METVIKVSQLNIGIKQLLEDNFAEVWVEGEVSNFRCYDSGHLYFTLKDSGSQIRAVMFRSYAQSLSVTPKDGDAVVVKATIGLYMPRGEYQLVVRCLMPVGIGELYHQFIRMKAELQGLGWFDTALKKTIPRYPRAVGVITSPSGAAVQDIINIITRRSPWVTIIVYPTLVQGLQAAEQIVSAIGLANQRKECDLLIVGRGGGSLEDLWPFNERIVAQAILESKIPIISAVGHETDFSISDFVADLRAPTPSAAAELATSEDRETIENYLCRCRRVWIDKIDHKIRSFEYQLTLSKHGLGNVVYGLREQRVYLQRMQQDLCHNIRQIVRDYGQRLDRNASALAVLNPEQVMKRGYAIIRREGKLLASCMQVEVGQVINIQWHDGSVTARILSGSDTEPGC